MGGVNKRDVPLFQEIDVERIYGCQETHGQVHTDSGNNADRSAILTLVS